VLIDALLEAAFASGKLRLKQQGDNSFALQANIGGARITLSAVQLLSAEDMPLEVAPKENSTSAQVVPFPGGAA